MVMPSPFRRILHRFGCMVSVCLLMFLVVLPVQAESEAQADSGSAMAPVLGVQPPHATLCHSATVCADFVAPARALPNALTPVRKLRFRALDAVQLVQFGPSMNGPPPRV